jgi:hypothetical protein
LELYLVPFGNGPPGISCCADVGGGVGAFVALVGVDASVDVGTYVEFVGADVGGGVGAFVALVGVDAG